MQKGREFARVGAAFMPCRLRRKPLFPRLLSFDRKP
mgnify:CR=1 FL=1